MSASILNPESAEPMMEINTTPLIDVMLVLLIMFIITVPIATHAVKLNLPVGYGPPPLDEPQTHRIDLQPGGALLWDGTPLPAAALPGRLDSFLAAHNAAVVPNLIAADRGFPSSWKRLQQEDRELLSDPNLRTYYPEAAVQDLMDRRDG